MGLDSTSALRIVPLGGLGHIGGNMMVYETENDIVVVDCGLLFPTEEQPGIDYVIPDISYLSERLAKVRCIVLTHGHEDHIGALPYVLPKLPVPVYGSHFTTSLVASKLAAFPECQAVLRTFADHEAFRFGDFTIRPIPVTHSIPGAVALRIETPCGTVMHTGDFKIDPAPVDGRLTDTSSLAEAGQRGVTVLLSDSTNAEKPGHTFGEAPVAAALDELITTAPFRVVVTSFASHIHRLQAVIRTSERVGRKVVLVGRSVQANVQMALEQGYLEAKPGTLVAPEDFEKLPRSRTTVIAAGSQGEPQSSMSRIASDQHPLIHLAAGDRVIFSSRRIPGNERAISAVVNNFWRLGVEVIDDHQAQVHASGHAFAGELAEMLALIRPQFFVPIHGEYRHLARHAQLAQAAGLAPDRTFVLEDGAPLALVRVGDTVVARREEPVPAGFVFVDGKGVGDVGEVVLRDRRVLAETGVVTCVVIVAEDGSLVAGPTLTTRGVVHEEHEQALLARAAQEIKDGLAALAPHTDRLTRAEEMRQIVRRFFRRELDRRPLVLPVVMTM